MPDAPGPGSRLPRRALWVAPALALGLAAVLGVAMRLPSVGSSPAAPSGPVMTASTSPAATPSDQFGGRTHLEPRLKPVEAAGDRMCASRQRIVRVLQFNIRFGVSRGGSVDPGRLAAEIRAVRPDLVSLNEVDSGTLRSGRLDEAGYLAEATGLHAVYGPNTLWDGGYFGNAILTRFPVVEAHNVRLPTVAGLEPRGLLTVTVQVGRRTVSFSSTHLSDGSDGRRSRILQAQAIAGVVRHGSGPTIVAGDLNSRPGSFPVRIVRQYLLDAQQEGGVGPGDTVPESAPSSRIDYVLYDDDLIVVPGSTRVLPSASSDHRSVFTELALRPSRCGG